MNILIHSEQVIDIDANVPKHTPPISQDSDDTHTEDNSDNNSEDDCDANDSKSPIDTHAFCIVL